MKLTQRAIDLVKEFEGMRLKAYLDPVGIVTIGYGYTNRAGFGPGVKMGDVWTEEKADVMLVQGLNLFGDKIKPHIKAPITANQFGAFVSLAYNIGWQSFIKSTALKRFNAGDTNGAAEAMMWWNKAGGEVLRGLTRRRQAEVDLFLSEPRAAHSAGASVKPDPERTSPAKSTTLQAAAGAAVSGAGSAAYAVGQLDSTAQTVVAVGAVIAGLCLAWIMRERLRKWAGGDR